MKKKDKITVAILATDFIKWGGGVDFIRLCLFGMCSPLNQDKYKIKILLPKEFGLRYKFNLGIFISKGIIKQVLKVQIPKIKKPAKIDYFFIEEAFKQVDTNLEVFYFSNTRSGLINILEELNVDIVLPSIQNLGKDFPIPWIGYLYDFQHKYYPEFFSLKSIKSRDKVFEIMLTNATSVIVNAFAVKKDIEQYIPNSTSQIFCLPFAPITFSEYLELKKDKFIELEIPAKYFILCNQFWIHKDHKTAFKAFKLFLDSSKEKDVFLVCTGKTYDERFPELFSDLNNFLKKEGIINKVIFTGYLPKVTQVQLLCDSIALIQPTLFEGGPGGFSVYDALAYGTSVIVSDIPVNKEINNYVVTFFQAGSASDLAEKMHHVSGCPRIKVKTAILEAKTLENILNLGKLLHETIQFTLKAYNRINN